MADEVKRIIEIEAKYETLAQLQRIINTDKEALENLTKGSYAYAKTQTELKAVQREFNQEMRIAVKATTSAKNSYNDLVNQLAELKEAWKQSDPSSDAFKEYTRQINKVKGELEAFDHSIGNYQSNVGNYANSISSVAGLFGGKFSAAVSTATQKVGLLTKALNILKAHPIIAVLGALVAVISAIAKGFKVSEEAAMQLSEALSPLKAGGDLVKNTFEGLAKAVAKVAKWLGEAAEKMGLFSENMKKRQLLQKLQNELTLQERDILIENQNLRAKAEEARNQAANKANLTEQQRIDLLRKAESYMRQISQNELYLAEKRLNIAIREKNLAPNDPEANRELAEAQAEVYRIQGDISQQTRRITSQISTAQEEQRREIDKTTEAVDKQRKAYEKLIEKLGGYNAKHQEAMESRQMEGEWLKEWDKLVRDEDEALTDEINRIIEEQQDEAERHKKFIQDTISNYQAVAAGISSVLDSVAGAWQNEIKAQVDAGKISEEEGERQFENVKALQYATTWINTLSAAIAALASPEPMPWAVKIANAASATAAGIANTIKIANTTLGNTQTSSAVGSGVQSVQTVAPAVQVAVPEYRTLTSASDEQSINDRYANQKVVLVTSELEAHNEGRKVKLAEATF